jgi:membrane dipeptidase
MNKKLVSAFLFSLLILLPLMQTAAQTMPKDADPKLWARALEIHKRAIIVDGHNDITTPMYDEDFDIGSDSRGRFHTDGDIYNPGFTPYHTDLTRLKASGITGLFFSLYVSGDYAKAGGSTSRILNQIDAVYRAAENYPNRLTLCTTAAQIRAAKKAGKVCALMGVEGGHGIEDSLATLREFYRLGVRYMTLTHINTNHWADSCCDEAKNNGLSPFGKDVVREMNRLGMLVDLAHVSEKTMSDALDVSTAPVIFSHSSAKHFSSHNRDVSDDILKRVTKNGGVVMVNFYPSFLDQRYLDESRERDKKLKPQLDALKAQYGSDHAGYSAAERKLFAENPIYVPSYTKIVDHIDYIKSVAGIDHVGIGSDFDGVGILPQGLNGMEDLVLVTYEMLRRGYSETEVRKVLGENFLRAFAGAEAAARINTRKISGEGNLEKIKK